MGLARAEKVKVVDGSSVSSTVAELNADPRVDFAQPNFRYTPNVANPEPLEPKLWGLDNTGQTPEANYSGPGTPDVDINAPQAWATTTGDSSVVVAVIDTGVDIGHSDLVGAKWTNPGEIQNNGIDDDANGYIDDLHGWDFLNNNASVYDGVTCSGGEDEDFHGTHVAGTIAAQRNNMGVVGVAPGVRVMSLKALGCSGGDTSTVIDALNYAKAEGAKIVNMSLGGPGYDQAFKDAIDASGVLVVAAAGNGGDDQIGDNNDNPGSSGNDYRQYPGAFSSPNILAVAAVNNVGALSSFSNYGPASVDVAGPGQSVVSDYPRDAYGASQYVFLDGTSMATPHVTGTAALVLSTDLALTPAQMKSRIMSTTRPLPSLSGKILTGGLVDANGAVLDVSAVRQATAMSFTRSAMIITSGQSVTLTTKLTQAGQSQVNRTVKLYRYLGGWKAVCTARTNSLGVASCVQKPSVNADFYWGFGGDLGLLPTTSNWYSGPKVLVRPLITAKMKPYTISKGGRSVFYGTVSPSKVGSKLVLQKRVGSKWVSLRTTRVTSRNTYSFPAYGTSRGKVQYRAYFYADSRNASQGTSIRTLTVV
ncbi:MAG TPA: hypothetical protein DCR52_01245 [Actinobacteria bacterium]|nr:hypothetical protein [Actinomycetota bacterium]